MTLDWNCWVIGFTFRRDTDALIDGSLRLGVCYLQLYFGPVSFLFWWPRQLPQAGRE